MTPSTGSGRPASLLAASQADASPKTTQVPSPSSLFPTSITKTRTSHACDRCRAMRTKCSGGVRCTKCVKDDGICVYGDRKRERNKKDLVESTNRVRALKHENATLVAALERIVANTELLTTDYADALSILEQHRRFKTLESPQDSSDQNQLLESPTDTYDSFETIPEQKPPQKSGEKHVSSSIGSPGKLGELSRIVNLDHGAGAAGFVGKMSEISWMQRAREYLVSDAAKRESAANAEYDRHAIAAQDFAYFVDDWNLLAVDEDYIDSMQRPTYQIALLLTEAFFHSAYDAFHFITRDQFFDRLLSYAQQKTASTWQERRWLAIANMVWAVGSKWLNMTDLDRTLPEGHLVFYARARALGIDHRVFFDHPDMEMLQGIGLLAFYLFINGSITRARNVLGHAVQHATALGLHLEVTDPAITEIEQGKRAKIWYSLYSLDILIAEVTGRPVSIQSVQVTVRLETLDYIASSAISSMSLDVQRDSKQLWDHFLEASRSNIASGLLEFLHTTSSAEGEHGSRLQVFQWHIRLCRISDQIAVNLYCGGSGDSWADTQNKIENYRVLIGQWEDSLPRELRLIEPQILSNGETLPLSLAMYHQSVLMILHRSCLCEIIIADETQRSRNFNVASAQACVRAAMSMIALMPDDTLSDDIWHVLPWWTLLHYLCQALAVLLLQLCLDCQHCPDEIPKIVSSAMKGMSFLHSMSSKSLSAYRAWRALRRLLTEVSTRYGGPMMFGLSESVQHPPNWTEAHELSLSALLA